MVPWSSDFSTVGRVAKIRCYGVPLQSWCKENFFDIASTWGEVLEIDDATLDKSNLDYGLFTVLTKFWDPISQELVVSVDNELFTIKVQELPHPCNLKHGRNSYDNSSDYISSSEDYYSDSAAEEFLNDDESLFSGQEVEFSGKEEEKSDKSMHESFIEKRNFVNIEVASNSQTTADNFQDVRLKSFPSKVDEGVNSEYPTNLSTDFEEKAHDSGSGSNSAHKVNSCNKISVGGSPIMAQSQNRPNEVSIVPESDSTAHSKNQILVNVPGVIMDKLENISFTINGIKERGFKSLAEILSNLDSNNLDLSFEKKKVRGRKSRGKQRRVSKTKTKPQGEKISYQSEKSGHARKGIENKRRDDFLHQLTGSNSFNYGDELERGIKDAPDVKIFSFNAILVATNNFSNENKLGQGGYGPVYKGELSDGREIAVKRLSKASGQGIMEFKSELVLISKLQHTNLVRLYGCCVHREEKMLIYEFMPNKSLDFFLFAKDGKEKIGWQIRFNIIEGIAQGLLYLHKYSRMKIVHRDLKVGNILLDENMNPKIADFGMARTFQQNVAEAITNRVVGTFGYMAPEYAMEGIFSIKSDVFSFGVLILEIVSGKRNSSFYNPDRPLNLAGYAWELWNGHASLELKDETLGESFDAKQLLRAIHVGLLCVQENADDRPTMSDVIYILNNENIDLPSPKEPAFFNGRQTTGFRLNEPRSTDDLLGRPIQVSENGLTVTTMEAR